MSDSGFSGGLPPSPPINDRALPPGRADLRAEIIRIRGELRVRKMREKMEGEIIRNNKDGTSVIRTDKGEITVRFRTRALPPEGQKVEIEIGPGAPPRQLIVRPPPADPVPAKTGTPPPQTTLAPTEQASKPAPPAAPLEQETTKNLRASPPPAPPQQTPQPLPLDSTVRLIPLTAGQAAEIITAPAEILATRTSVAGALTTEAQKEVPVNLISPSSPETRPEEKPSGRISQPQTETISIAKEILPRLSLPVLQNIAPLPPAVPANLQAPIKTIWEPSSSPAQASQPKPALDAAVKLSPLPAVPASETGNARMTAPASLTLLPVVSPLPETQKSPTQNTLSVVKNAPKTQIGTGLSPDLREILPPGSIPVNAKAAPFDAKVQYIAPPAVRLVALSPALAAPEATGPITIKPFPHVETTNTAATTLRKYHQTSAAPPVQAVPFAGQTIARVVGKTAQGNLPVIAIGLPNSASTEIYALQFNAANLPIGSSIALTPQPGSIMPRRETALMPQAVPLFDLLAGFQWPAFDELNQALQQIAAQTTVQILGQTLPNPAAPSRMPAAILFFVAAVRAGDLGGWLGDKTVDALRRAGKGELLNRLSRDIGTLSRLGSEPVTQEWRATALPLFYGGDIHKLQLFYRHDERSKDERDDRQKATRFLFDLSLDRMGAVQLDGLHRPGRLDLAVRTLSPLSQNMQKHMRRLYINAIEQAGVSGELSFQNNPGQFVKIELPKEKIGVSA